MLARLSHHLPLLAHNRNFRWYWTASLCNAFEELLSFTAVTLHVLNLTGSGESLALAWSVQMLPALLVGSIAGVVADRFNRKIILILSGGLAAVTFVGYTLSQTVAQLFVLIAVVSVALTFARTASLALLPDVVRESEIVDANALVSMNFNVSLMLAPLLAGALVAASGAQFAFYLLATLRLLSLLALGRVAYQHKIHETASSVTISWLSDLRAGVRYARDHFVIRTMLLTYMGMEFGGGSLIVLEAVLIKQVLNAGDTGYGLLLSLAGLGAICGSLLIKPLTTRWPLLRIFSLCAFFTGLTFFPYGLVLWFPITLVIAIIQTMTWVLGEQLANILVQQVVPEALRGRIVGLMMLLRSGMTLLVMMIYGPLIDSIGVVPLMLTSGVVYSLAGAYAIFRFRHATLVVTPTQATL